MDRRRLLVLGVAVTALLVVAGVASRGRPLAGSRGSGPTATFFDYVFTTVVLVALAVLAVALYAALTARIGRPTPARRRWYLLSSLVTIALSAAVAWALWHSGFERRLMELEKQHALTQQQQQRGGRPAKPTHVRGARVRWDEVAIVAALVAGAVVLLLAGRTTRRPPRPWRLRSQEQVSLALDESLDDLRADPDLRRAIIAAYARMERALARAGLPRHPAEAPFEYVERALRSLDASAASARTLTGLFEWAKFSQHEPEPAMRDEAIAALVAVRDELRAPAREEAVPA